MTINRSPSEDEEGEENSMPKTRNGGYEKVELQVETTEEHSDAASSMDSKTEEISADTKPAEAAGSMTMSGFSFLDDW
ncbi:hypothetical protein ScPMuIL_011691 [Solemya velum]